MHSSSSTLVSPASGVGASSSVSGGSLASGGSSGGPGGMGSASGVDTAWAQLHVCVLPLFNGERLLMSIEDLNELVRRHIESVTSTRPSRALTTLAHDAAELIDAGMLTLNAKAKLESLDESKLVSRVVEIWNFFWDQVLPYVEGVFLPLQTHPLVNQLNRTHRTQRSASNTISDTQLSLSANNTNDGPGNASAISLSTLTPSTLVNGGGLNLNGSTTTLPLSSSATIVGGGAGTSKNGTSGAFGTTGEIDIRALALKAFRDNIIFPVSARLETKLRAVEASSVSSVANANGSSNVEIDGAKLTPGPAQGGAGYQQPRLQQMLLVLLSQAPRSATPYPRNGAFRAQGNFPPYAYQNNSSSPTSPSTATSSQFLFSLNSPDIPPPAPSEPEVAMRKLLDALVSATHASASAAAISTAKLQANKKDQEQIAEQQYKQLRQQQQQQQLGGVYGFGWGLGGGLGSSASVDTARSPAPSFLSGGAPRDRRGRVGTRPPAMHLNADTDLDGRSVMSVSATSQATVTPTSSGPKAVRHKPAVLKLRANNAAQVNGAGIDGVGGSAVDGIEAARERDRLLLESLRSPEVPQEARPPVQPKRDEAEDMNWDEAQAAVERLMGMNAPVGTAVES